MGFFSRIKAAMGEAETVKEFLAVPPAQRPVLVYVENDYSWNADTARLAAMRGHLDVFKWGFDNGCYLYRGPSVMSWAAMSGSIDLLSWLLDKGFEWNGKVCRFAAMKGHLHVLKWARSHGIPFDGDTWPTAVRKRHVPTIDWLREMGCPGSV